MYNKVIFTRLQVVCFSLIFVFAHYYIVNNVYLLSRDMLYGDFSATKVKPAPYYYLARIPDTPLASQFDAYNHLAYDFAQVYFPANEFDELNKNYIFGEFDPEDRPSRYAPFVHYVCSITYCKFKYGPASLVHLFLQLFLFYGFFIWSFIILKLKKYIPAGMLFVNLSLFLTPAGLSWFERGQFSLYVALSYLLVIFGVLKKKTSFILLGAFFAFIKWTSFPAIFIILLVFILAAVNSKELKIHAYLVTLFCAVIILLLVFFPNDDYFFLKGLYQQELFAVPQGVSMAMLLPGYVKFMPLLLILVGFLYIRKYRSNMIAYLPFFTGVGILMLTYPTIAYVYNIPAMLCFVPFMIYWSNLPGNYILIRKSLTYVLLLFLLSGSSPRVLLNVFGFEKIEILLYLMVSAMFLIAPLILPFYTWSREDQKTTYENGVL